MFGTMYIYICFVYPVQNVVQSYDTIVDDIVDMIRYNRSKPVKIFFELLLFWQITT